MDPRICQFQNNIATTISRYSLLLPGDGLIVAVSGGADSLALLVVLQALPLNLQLTPVYVDHGLRPNEIPHEIELIQNLCQSLNLTLTIKPVDVKGYCRIHKKSTEDAARFLRYRALEEVRTLHNHKKIAVAHHADDQVEEFFIRLLRGSAVKALSGMQIENGKIIRPLLLENRQTIEQFLTIQNIPWSTDSSNLSRDYLRNRIRLDLLPDLEKAYNPALRKTVLQTMDVLREEDRLLHDLTGKSYRRCVQEVYSRKGETQNFCITVNSEIYLTLELALRRRVLEKICWKLEIPPSFIIISEIDHLITTAENSKTLHLADGVRVVKSKGQILFSRPYLGKNKRGSTRYPKGYELTIQQPGHYFVPGTAMTIGLLEQSSLKPADNPKELRVDLTKLAFPLLIRGLHPGEKFIPCNSAGSKKISRYYNEQKLDKLQRQSWPILFSGDSVVAIIGYNVDHRYRVTETTEKILHITCSGTLELLPNDEKETGSGDFFS
ncbi:tRNA lysidine(34) synthetase TilS [Desulforhopalus sp. IMCC35007]|uniref:tRNA lysidine(34) synthetase TilS n=1 Tax=Desulforhopalus sp. IMCC35007 TaxID=2569543 RepID=UPI0010AE8BBA|nr:tRNA lysidine(34) synthetase TilS [Desulforhopalus sp. IMCC35007]TKB09399.1 tRNA lysidine(34) synthetase TilS [Desulforhopalus sp. IMCC35007]